jgi:hypothetical protein
MNKLLARYLADFNGPRYEWYEPEEEPGSWSTLMVVAVLALVGFLVGR